MTDTFEPTIIEWTHGTKEYVRAVLGADANLDASDVEIRVLPLDWQEATWVGSVGETRELRSTDVVDTAALSRSIMHSVFARFTDNPEVPIILLGRIRLVT
jgi:hypothetical protein